jgi:hypothetical protein
MMTLLVAVRRHVGTQGLERLLLLMKVYPPPPPFHFLGFRD